MTSCETVQDYLTALLQKLWFETEGFSAKRPFGDSAWELDLYAALIQADYISGSVDEDGIVEDADEQAGFRLIRDAIAHLGSCDYFSVRRDDPVRGVRRSGAGRGERGFVVCLAGRHRCGQQPGGAGAVVGLVGVRLCERVVGPDCDRQGVGGAVRVRDDPNPPPELVDALDWVKYVAEGGWPTAYATQRYMPLIWRYIRTLELDAAGVPVNER